MSQNEEMSESPVQTLEKVVGLHLIWTGGITSLWHLERHTEFNASKGADALHFLKMDRNPNITVPIESEPQSPASPPDASVLSC